MEPAPKTRPSGSWCLYMVMEQLYTQMTDATRISEYIVNARENNIMLRLASADEHPNNAALWNAIKQLCPQSEPAEDISCAQLAESDVMISNFWTMENHILFKAQYKIQGSNRVLCAPNKTDAAIDSMIRWPNLMEGAKEAGGIESLDLSNIIKLRSGYQHDNDGNIYNSVIGLPDILRTLWTREPNVFGNDERLPDLMNVEITRVADSQTMFYRLVAAVRLRDDTVSHDSVSTFDISGEIIHYEEDCFEQSSDEKKTQHLLYYMRLGPAHDPVEQRGYLLDDLRFPLNYADMKRPAATGQKMKDNWALLKAHRAKMESAKKLVELQAKLKNPIKPKTGRAAIHSQSHPAVLSGGLLNLPSITQQATGQTPKRAIEGREDQQAKRPRIASPPPAHFHTNPVRPVPGTGNATHHQTYELPSHGPSPRASNSQLARQDNRQTDSSRVSHNSSSSRGSRFPSHGHDRRFQMEPDRHGFPPNTTGPGRQSDTASGHGRHPERHDNRPGQGDADYDNREPGRRNNHRRGHEEERHRQRRRLRSPATDHNRPYSRNRDDSRDQRHRSRSPSLDYDEPSPRDRNGSQDRRRRSPSTDYNRPNTTHRDVFQDQRRRSRSPSIDYNRPNTRHRDDSRGRRRRSRSNSWSSSIGHYR